MYKEQYLDFIWNESCTLDTFIVFSGNKKAFEFLKQYQNGQVLLHAPPFSGKSHLANIFFSKYEQYNLDNTQLSEAALVDIYNQQRNILWISSYNINQTFVLPDIRTRFNAMLKLTISEPDEETFKKILQKRCRDYGFEASDIFLTYVSRRIDITYYSIEKFTVEFYKYCLLYRKQPSIYTAAEMLNDSHIPE